MSKLNIKNIWYVRWLVIFCVILMILLIGADFWLSFTALNQLAESTGYTKAQAFVWPLTIDAGLLMVTILIFVTTLSKWDKSFIYYCYALLVIFSLVTIAGNILSVGVLTKPFDVTLLISLFVHLCPPVFYVLLTEASRLMLNNMVADDFVTLKRESREKKVSLTNEMSQIDDAREQKRVHDEASAANRHETILNQLSHGSDISVTQLAEDCNVSRTTIYRDLENLTTNGQISKNGDGYEVTK